MKLADYVQLGFWKGRGISNIRLVTLFIKAFSTSKVEEQTVPKYNLEIKFKPIIMCSVLKVAK